MSSFERVARNNVGDVGFVWSGNVSAGDLNEAARRERELLEKRARTRLAQARRRRRALVRRRRVGVLIMLGVLSFGMRSVVGAFTALGGRATTRHAASVSWNHVAGPSFVVPGRLAAFTWPHNGEAAVGIQGSGVIAHSPRERVVPIASMTKMMTAILILRDHPLHLGELGPSVLLSAADVRAWVTDSQNGDSVVPVRAGERLNEFQLLEALLMSSGDNIADILAQWDDHSIGAFVGKMNLHARQLKLAHTVYADASGVNARSRSTPSDQIIVAGELMRNPVARLIVAQKSVPFPVAGTIPNFNPALGTDGIIGVKSGFTHAAMGCLAVATMRTVGHHQVMMIAVSTGSLLGLYGAARVDEQLIAEAQPDLVTISPIHRGSILANIILPRTTTPTLLHLLHQPQSFVAWRGAHLRSTVFVNPLANPGGTGVVARLVYSTPTGTVGGAALTSVPLGSGTPGTSAS
ncbi:MAG TPA: hypothetical protein VMU99_07760 [Acidimicrobiales bacterium]|nr:hypothetical protein [Acidimicrobiales bacterium]